MTQRLGNTTVISILIVLIVVATGIVWYYGFAQPAAAPTNTVDPVTNTSTLDPADEAQLNVETPNSPTVTTTEDLDTASTTLDQVDLNAGQMDNDQLGSYADEF